MRKLYYLLLIILMLPSCVKDEDKAPDTSDLPKRIKTAIFFDHNVESQKIEYIYYLDKIVKAELYSRSTGKWELVNILNYEYDLPNVTLTVDFNLLGTWSTTAKIEYVIEDGRIQKMDDYTHFYGNWRHDVSTSYFYSDDLLEYYIQETLDQDTVSYSKKQEYRYSDKFSVDSKEFLMNDGGWDINKHFVWDYIIGGTGGYRILEFDADSVYSSEIEVITVGGLITKRETIFPDAQGQPNVVTKSETFKYFQVDHLLYSDMQTEFLFQHVNYYYENAEGNISWFNHPQDELEATPRPKAKGITMQTINIVQKARR